MQTRELVSLIKKDIKVGLILGKIHILTCLVFPLIMLAFLVVQLTKSTNGEELRIALATFIVNFIPYIIIFIMMFAGNAIIQIAVSREKTQKTILPLLSMGVRSDTFWLAKIVATFIITSICALGFALFLLGFILVLNPSTILVNLSFIVINMVVAPFLPMVFIGMTGLMYMVSVHFWPVTLLFTVSPIFLLPYWQNILNMRNGLYITCIVLLSLVILAVLRFLACCVSRERLSGVFEQA